MSRDLMDESYYVSHGGRIPVKWTAPEVEILTASVTFDEIFSLRLCTTRSTPLLVMCGAMELSCTRYGVWDTSPMKTTITPKLVQKMSSY